MGAGIAVARLIIADKRSEGYPTAHSWGIDFPMTNLDSSRQIAGPYQNAARQRAEWDLTDVIPLPQLNAAVLDGAWGFKDMDLSKDWLQESSSYWKLVQPPGQQTKWIKYYDGRADQIGAVVSRGRLIQNPTWGFRFLRAQPPDGQTDPVYSAITLNALGTVQYQLYIQHDEWHYPSLWKSVDSGASWTQIDSLARDDAARWAAGAFMHADWISCLFIPDHLIFWLGDMPDPWIYHEPELNVPEGHVRVEVGGGQSACHFDELTFAASGTVERLIHLTPPDMINNVADTMYWYGKWPAGTSISAQMLTDGQDRVYPKATLSSDTKHTPILYSVQGIRPAAHASPTTTTLFDNTQEADKGKLESVEFTVAQNWRGSSFKALLRTTGDYDFTGNEKAQVRVALDIGGELSYTNQVTGFLETPKRRKSGDHPGEVPLELVGHDRFCRLRKKRAWLLPSFAGWNFYDAWYWLMHERAGVPDSELSIDAGASDFVYPCRLGELTLKFDNTLDIVTVADHLARAAGREWGVDQSGAVFTRALGTTPYSGSPDWTLDEDTVTEDDVAYFIDFDRDLFEVCNHQLVIGQDAEGNDVVAVWRHTKSMSDPESDPFIGDDWWQVSVAPDGGNPWLIAAFSGTQLLNYRALLIWETDGKPALFPDHYVAVQTTQLDIPTR